MRADFSRLTFDPSKNYAGVLHQQGRVWLDADWNEDVLTRLDKERKLAADLVGACGAPPPGTAFQIIPQDGPDDPLDFLIGGGDGGAGHYFVNGVLARLIGPSLYSQQPDFPAALPIQLLPTGVLRAIVYLEVWRRLITHVDDDSVREIALGGPDTATRLKTVAQVKVLPISDPTIHAVNAASALPQPGQGTLSTLQPTNSATGTPCSLPDPTNYTGRENHLYRVEIHNAGGVAGQNITSDQLFQMQLAQDVAASAVTITLQGTLTPTQVNALTTSGAATLSDDVRSETVGVKGVTTTTAGLTQLSLAAGLLGSYAVARNATLSSNVARFKWSRDNAAFAVRVLAIDSSRQILTLSSLGQDQTSALTEFDLVEISDDAAELGPRRGFLTTLASNPDPDQFTVTLSAPLTATFDVNRNMTLRRWDGVGWAFGTYAGTGTPDLNLGDGVQIQFGGSNLRAGDYWLFTSRSLDGSVEPLSNSPPSGTASVLAPLAIVNWSPQVWFDFPTINSAVQSAAQPATPVTSLLTRLTAVQQSGIHQGQPLTSLDFSRVQAIAEQVGTAPAAIQAIQARLNLLSSGGVGATTTTLTVEEDCRISFNPLAPPALRIQDVRTVSPDLSLLNDESVSVDAIIPGLKIVFSDAVDPTAFVDRPVCQFSVEMPFPFLDLTAQDWGTAPIGTFLLTLGGALALDATNHCLTWTPSPGAAAFLKARLFVLSSPPSQVPQAFAHLLLKGRFIWSGSSPVRWLDGESLGVSRSTGPSTGLALPSGNSRRAGDFDMWFRLLPSSSPTPPKIVSFTPNASSVSGGNQITGSITLGNSTSSPVTINLTSSNPSVVNFPSPSVQIPLGGTQAQFAANTIPVSSDTPVTLTAQIISSPPGIDGPHIQSVTVQRPRVASVTLNPSRVSGGLPSTGTITFTGAMPPSGLTVAVISGTTAAATVAAGNLTIPANASTATFPITTFPVSSITPVNLIVTLSGSGVNEPTTVPLTVQGGLASMTPGSLTLSQNEAGSLQVSLTCPSNDDITVNLSSSAPSVVSLAQATLVFSASTRTVTLPVAITAGTAGTAIVTATQASANGSLPSQSSTVTVSKAKEKEKDSKEHKDKDKDKDKDNKDVLKDKEGHIEVKLPHETFRLPLGLPGRPLTVVEEEEEEPMVWVRMLAARVDELEKRLATSRAFIAPEERPEVGRKAIDQADGDGKPPE
jgi:hypothetical protein